LPLALLDIAAALIVLRASFLRLSLPLLIALLSLALLPLLLARRLSLGALSRLALTLPLLLLPLAFALLLLRLALALLIATRSLAARSRRRLALSGALGGAARSFIGLCVATRLGFSGLRLVDLLLAFARLTLRLTLRRAFVAAGLDRLARNRQSAGKECRSRHHQELGLHQNVPPKVAHAIARSQYNKRKLGFVPNNFQFNAAHCTSFVNISPTFTFRVSANSMRASTSGSSSWPVAAARRAATLKRQSRRRVRTCT
jgi:hypothetical protein